MFRFQKPTVIETGILPKANTFFPEKLEGNVRSHLKAERFYAFDRPVVLRRYTRYMVQNDLDVFPASKI